MFMGGDCNLNSSQVHTDSFKEILRQTMLNQEMIFRKQVHELHRIYVTQKTLMKDCYLRELNGLQSGNAASRQLIHQPFSDQHGWEPHSTEKIPPKIFLGGSTHSVQHSYTQESKDFCHRLYQRPKRAQNLSANCMNYIDSDISVADYNWDFIGISSERKNWLPDGNKCCPDEVKLSLSIGGSNKKKVVRRNFLTDKNSFTSSQEIIDLEEPAEMLSGYDNQPVFPIHGQVTSGPRKDAQFPSKSYQKLNDITVKDPADSFSTPGSCIGSNVSQERNFSKRGPNECYDGSLGDNMVTNGKLFTSNVATSLDLNKIQLEESSTHSNNSFLGYTSAASSSGDAILGLRNPNSNSSANVLEMIFKSKAKDENRTCSTDLKSISKLQSRDQPSNHSMDMDSHLNFQSGINIDIAKFEDGRNLNEDVNLVPSYRSQSATGDTHCSRRSSSCNFDCIVNDNLNVTKTRHSGTDLERGLSSSCLLQNAESSQVAVNACQLDLSSSSISKTELQVCDGNKGKLTDIDALIHEAAASLISISLESQTNEYACSTKSRSDEIQNTTREQLPEYSSDSYESMVMNLSETSADDYFVSSNPIEVNELCNKDTGIKLRRGRRLKDFQKDILPGMASLSRHEIREDINIMEGVLRSREYKRLRSKTAKIGNWFTPVKSRRSRLNYVGRKNYQW